MRKEYSINRETAKQPNSGNASRSSPPGYSHPLNFTSLGNIFSQVGNKHTYSSKILRLKTQINIAENCSFLKY